MALPIAQPMATNTVHDHRLQFQTLLRSQQFTVDMPNGRTSVVDWSVDNRNLEDFLCHIVRKGSPLHSARTLTPVQRQSLLSSAYLLCNGKVVTTMTQLLEATSSGVVPLCHSLKSLQLRFRIRGGADRQNRVGSKFGGGGVSSAANSERERKDRLKQLALESIDLAKDPYLIKNSVGTYECKLCLTLHRDESNYLAHTQGKKHQQGLARRAHQEKLKAERDGQADAMMPMSATQPLQRVQKVRIGRPAYQVFKSRDAETSQRCLSFELQYPDIAQDLQPRHRFMSAYEQQVERPPNPNYQYLLFAAEPYETVAFKIPNESIDRGDDRFVTHWDDATKKFTVTLYFMEPEANN